MVFIVGCPRSGTTWLQRLLAAHPLIETGQESRLFEYIGSQYRQWREDKVSPELTGRGGTGLACYLTEREFLEIQRNYLASILSHIFKRVPPGRIFLEKTPRHALFIPEIHELLPEAKIIHMVRDPRDVVASLLAAAKGWGRAWAPRKVRKAARIWCEHVNSALASKALLPETQFFEIHYEDLYQDPAKWLRAAASFLELPWAEPEIEAAVASNDARSLRKGEGTLIPVYGEHGKRASNTVQEPGGFVRKARPGTWREKLTFLEKLQLKFYLRGFAPYHSK